MKIPLKKENRLLQSAAFVWLAGIFFGQACSPPEPQSAEDLLSYRIDNVPLPEEMVPEISALGFSPEGRLVVANRIGEIWIREPDQQTWRRFAYGLHEPLGIQIVREDEILVAHKPEVTHLKDTDRDGIADTYLTMVDDWGISDNWHEHNFGLPKDAQGNLVIALGQADKAGPMREIYPRIPLNLDKVLGESKISATPWQGWVMKISPEGTLIPWANGFRMAAGVGVNPEGEVFVTDQQGDWIPSSNLIHVQKGRFYGHPASLKWDSRYAGGEVTTELVEELRSPEAVVFPHGSMGGSPGEPVWDLTEGNFGPFAGQVFVGDFTRLLMRVDMEKVNGEYQGAVFPFIRDATGAEDIMAFSGGNNLTIPAGGEGRFYFEDVPPRPGTRLRQGNMHMAFAPDGSLYVGQTTRGWVDAEEGIQRVVWSGNTPSEIKTMRISATGFDLTFTKAMDQEAAVKPENYKLSRFRYLYSSGYGSPRADKADVPIKEVILSENGETASLVLDELLPGFVYRLEVDKLVDDEGKSIENPLAYYTLNQTLDGQKFEGKLSEAMFETSEPEERAGPDLGNGARLYRTFCIACHQEDGKGGSTEGFSSPDLTAQESPLRTKSSAALLRYIAGVEQETLQGRTMPSFGNFLNEQEIEDVFHYINSTFKSD